MNNENDSKKEQWFFIPMPVWVPGVLSGLALLGAFWFSPWVLLAIPFVWLGALCSSPNMNLIEGAPVLLTFVVGLIWGGSKPLAFIIGIATVVSWVASSYESWARARPVEEREKED